MVDFSRYKEELFLIQQLRAGDEKAFEFTFELYYKPLCLYARKLVNDEDLSEEIAHNAFCNLWVKRKEIKITSSIKSYLLRTVHNASISHLRHKKIHAKYAEEKYYQFVKNDVMLTPNKEVEIINSELSKKIYEAIDSLPNKCQEVFRLSRISGLKNQEIADELGVSINTVQTQMKIALKKLRVKLGDQRFLLLILSFSQDK